MAEPKKIAFDAADFLAKAGLGRRIVELRAGEVFFSQGHAADAIFYVQNGRAKLTVVSESGKEATVSLLTAGDFVGEESLAAVAGLRLATATAITRCTALKIERDEMIRVMHEEHEFSGSLLEFSARAQHAHSGRSGRSALQLQRKASGQDPSAHGRIRPARSLLMR